MATNPKPHPSGEQFDISHGDQHAVVTEVGATLREYTVKGRHRLDGFAREEMCSGGPGQVLAPWPNRLRDGAYQFGGRSLQLGLSESERHNAIHGLVRWVPWRLLDRAPHRVRLAFTLHPQPGYPFMVDLSVQYTLLDAGLRVSTVARNLGVEAAPFGIGNHPYLRPAQGMLDRAVLQLPADRRLEVDERLLPTGRLLPVAGTAFDFREPRQIGDTVLDACFTDLAEPFLELDGVRLWWDATHPYVQLFSGDTLSRERRRRGLAVEPMSCPADAFNSGIGLVVLEAGGDWSGSWGISAEAVDSG